jgi:hypothetical protein
MASEITLLSSFIHPTAEKVSSRKHLKYSGREIMHRETQERGERMTMQPRKEITRRSFLKLGFASISASALVFIAGCGGGGNKGQKKKK